MLKKTTRRRAFTLIEMLISMALFGIVSVTMTGIVLNIADASVVIDRRSDFLAEIESVVENLKNEMRNAQSIGICAQNSGNLMGIYVVKKPLRSTESQVRFYRIAPMRDNGEDRMALMELSFDPMRAGGLCQDKPGASVEYLNSRSMKIRNFVSAVSSDNSSPRNTLIYVYFEACDSSSVYRKVFDCDSSSPTPYRYIFGVSTRNY